MSEFTDFMSLPDGQTTRYEWRLQLTAANKRVKELEVGLMRFACDQKNCQCYRLDMSDQTKRTCSYGRAAELLKDEPK